ncbi:MAG: fused MFS/spermidine synthase [Gammaproteobacteria bacterium]|nr:fused MFS/spermidine synthase [Gammaproteobacteria bacterium]
MAFVVNETTLTGNTIHTARSFFSTYAVRVSNDASVPSRRLVAGTHVHGEQLWLPEFEHVPVAYYHERTGLAHIIKATRPTRFGIVGLGVGAAVEYAEPGDHVDIYELDPIVVQIASTYFTVLRESAATIDTIVGDGRVRLREAKPGSYDLLVLDAFTSGSIPTHLLTVEAIGEMISKLSSNGVIAYHISNQHVDLLPVLHGAADALGLEIHYHRSAGQPKLSMFPATWVMLSPNPAITTAVIQSTPG